MYFQVTTEFENRGVNIHYIMTVKPGGFCNVVAAINNQQLTKKVEISYQNTNSLCKPPSSILKFSTVRVFL